MISIIASVANGNAIGFENRLLVRIPNDMKRFRTLTEGKCVIMGRNTLGSIGHRLPRRRNIVLSWIVKKGNGVQWTATMENALYYAGKEDVFIIGGESVFKQGIDIAERMYITRIYADFEADRFFPPIDDSVWRETQRIRNKKGRDGNPCDYDFITYERIPICEPL